jgi:hypothetical protein
METTHAATAQEILNDVNIPNVDDIRGYVTLPTNVENFPRAVISWTSSHPDIVTDKPVGKIKPGLVTRPPAGAEPAKVTLTAEVTVETSRARRVFSLTVRPSIPKLAEFSRYGMVNFARSNSTRGQQIYLATSNGNDAMSWVAANEGHAILTSSKGMYGVRDPSIVRSPEGDKFFMVATDLNVDGTEYGWKGWDWAQSGCSRYIEVWESTDLCTWSSQRHVLVSPPEVGMTFAPESIWDSEIGEYVVYWTSSMYPRNTHFTTDTNDPKRRYPLTRNQTLYATTRDFITFSPAKVMSGRPNHGTLDAFMILDKDNGHYHRFVCDRTSTGVGVTSYISASPTEDIYHERARSVLAPESDWELVAHGITHKTMNTVYAEAPTVVQLNPGDPNGKGYILLVDQIWEGAPSGQPMEEQLHPYWSPDLDSGAWKPISWKQKPEYDDARGVIRHGTIFNLTSAEHAAARGATLSSISVKPPAKTVYNLGEALKLEGLEVSAFYTDGSRDEALHEGYGGYLLSGLDQLALGKSTVTVYFTVVATTKTASFDIEIQGK